MDLGLGINQNPKFKFTFLWIEFSWIFCKNFPKNVNF